MADPLSITASIVGIATLGFQVAKGLYQFADGIGSAGEEVRLYAGEINKFSKLLNYIKEQVLPTPEIPFNSRSLIQDVLDICDKVLKPFDPLQKTLNSFFIKFRQSPRKLKEFGFRVRWVFRDKKNTRLGQLTNYGRQNPPNYLMSLENSMAAISISSNKNSRGGGFALQGTNEQPPSDFLISTGETTLLLAQDGSDISSNTDDTGAQPPEIVNGLNIQSSTALVVLQSNSDDHENQQATDDMQRLEQQIDQDLDPDSGTTAVEVWEDTRYISRKAKRLASEALSSREMAVTSSSVPLPGFANKAYTVGWVCTSPIEYVVAEGMLDEQHPTLPQVENDSNTYTLGRIVKHGIVLVCIPA